MRVARGLCEREGLFPPGRRVLVLVSGGQDSVALLHMAATGRLAPVGLGAIRALHVNHRLRGDQSEEDQRLVERHCEALGVPLTVRVGPVAKGSPDLQETAREVRRARAREVAAEFDAAVIALGHTLDDQVETMLYRLGRYGGLRALAAMRPRSGAWVRPLLSCRRLDTEAYCAAHGLDFARDRGNLDPGYARTGIRTRVVPAWEAVLPGAVSAAARGAEVAGEAADILAGIVADTGVWAGSPGEPSATVSAARLGMLSAPLRRCVLHALIEGLPGAHSGRTLVLEAEAMLSRPGSAALSLGGGWWFVKEYDRVRTAKSDETGTTPGRRSEPSADDRSLALPLPGFVQWGGLIVSAESVSGVRAHDPGVEAYVDERALQGRLEVRATRAGDRMKPLGAPGSRALQDVLVDLRVPRASRARVPVVLSGGRVVWLCGLVVAEEGRIRADTGRVVRLAVRSR